MNERIRLLAEQAGISFYPGQFNQVPVADVTIMDVEKFAELIVLECSAFVYNYPEKYLTRNQAREVCLGMEKDFGVEE